MSEIGVDLTTHYSKSVQAIDRATVGMVITLCAEEVCPVFLGTVRRLHWSIPDPASKDPTIPREEMHVRSRAARDGIPLLARSEVDLVELRACVPLEFFDLDRALSEARSNGTTAGAGGRGHSVLLREPRLLS